MDCPECNRENAESAMYCTECGGQLVPGVVRGRSAWCYVHPDVETALSCGSCERPICVQCLVQHPVGIRCRACARIRKNPVFDVSTRYYGRAVGAGLGIVIAGTFGLSLLKVALPFGSFFLAVAFVGLGYLVGEGISKAVNRKRSRGLQCIAGGCVFVIYVLTSMTFTGLYGLLALVAATYVAINRLGVR